MKYNFVHLSDLHYRSNWDEENGLVCRHLLEDIAEQMQGIGEAYVAFTGDLVFAADDAEGYEEFLKRFGSKFDEMKLDRSRRFSIPGNHDVARSALAGPKLRHHNASLTAIQEERQFNDGVELLTEHYFEAKFKRYKECEAAFAEHGCCSSDVGGQGYELPGGLGVYCLNTALSSCAGLKDDDGRRIDDKGKLGVDTRHLHRWLAATECNTRVLLAHHPLDWLQPWAKEELGRTITSRFDLVLTGHDHTADSFTTVRSAGRTMFCMAPALFTHKNETLGYAFITVDTDSQAVHLRYRQWSNQHRCFVAGTVLAGNDTGALDHMGLPLEAQMSTQPTQVNVNQASTLAQLKTELDESLLNYSNKRLMWVERDIADIPETQARKTDAKLRTPKDLALDLSDCIISAMREFGLTCVGKKIAYDYHANSSTIDVCIYIAVGSFDNHRRAVETHVEKRVSDLSATGKRIAGIIVDDWNDDNAGRKLVGILRETYPNAKLLLLQHIDAARNIEHALQNDKFDNGEYLFLWALTQVRIGELVDSYVADIPRLEPLLVTQKIIKDIDVLNIFRTPQNCLMFLRLAEHAFDDSPVNRTELIHRVLFLLFYQYDQIPTYASRPDLKDCEYVLGFICEWLLKEGRNSFSKHAYFAKATEYCKTQFINVDIEVLLQFLVASRIIVYRGNELEFRFAYWRNYFAAHRMHHDPDFASYILSDRRYATVPEIIEFYTGIDRRRVDAVRVMTADLNEMTKGVSERTGIAQDMDPYTDAKWKPTEREIGVLKQEVVRWPLQASLPDKTKHEFADRHFDRAKPYDQRISDFIERASLHEMFQATRAAARALRNSDYVQPAEKRALLSAIMTSWKRVVQALAVISTELAENSRATVAGTSFCLDRSFESAGGTINRWIMIMEALPDNVLIWFEDDLYSNKLGPLIYRYIEDNQEDLTAILLMMVLVRRRPDEWAEVVKRFVARTSQDSFGLLRVFKELRDQRTFGFVSDAATEHINHLSALALAKHTFETASPNRVEVRSAASILGDPIPPSPLELRESKGPRWKTK